MLEYLKPFKEANPDAFYFLPGENNKIALEGLTYRLFGDKVGGSELGDSFHIIIFREDNDGNMSELELFEAVLISPYDYLSRMLREGWYGMIAKKTTTSDKFVKLTFDKLSEVEETE